MKAVIPSVDEVFEQAMRLAPGSDRSAYLDEACGTDVDLRQRVDRLLKAFADAGSFLDSPAVPSGPTLEQPVPFLPGTQIGHYKLLQQIGEGGMGVVYMAEQTQPVHRKVALKIIKPGMDSRQVIARFEAERQALAMMDHINIARVIDGGTIPSPLSLEGRGAGGEGVPPEPGGVSPGSGSGSGRPYFVMELIHGIPITKYCDDNHLTPRERLELFIPVCQAIQHAHQKGIIHRDIKPSNVLVTIYDGKPVPKVIDFGVAKAIDQKLTDNTLFTNFGTMVGTLEYMSPEQAEMNNLGIDTRTDIYSLGVLLYELLTGSTPLTRKRIKDAANLEVLRMIKEEEPQKPSTRLSESGEALASISAMRNTEPAKLSKLMRGELDWIVMKTLEKDRNRRYETANGLAVEVHRYLADEPVQACPPSAGYRVRKFVRRNKVPVIAASLLLLALVGGIIGTTYGQLQANTQRDRAVTAEDVAKKRADELTLVLASVLNIGSGLQSLESLNEAEPFYRDAVEKCRKLLGSEDLLTQKAISLLGRLLLAKKQFNDAEPFIREAHDNYRRLLSEDHRDLRISIHCMGLLLQGQGKLEKAEVYFREAMEKARRFASEPETLDVIGNLGNLLSRRGKLVEAESYLRESIEKSLRLNGPEHSATLTPKSNLGVLLYEQGKFTEAEPYLREVWEVRRRLYGLENRATILSYHILGSLLRDQGKLNEAEPMLRDAMIVGRRVQGETNPFTLNFITGFGTLLLAQKKYTEVIELLTPIEPATRKIQVGDNVFRVGRLLMILGQARTGLNQFATAEANLTVALPLYIQTLGPTHRHTRECTLALVSLYSAWHAAVPGKGYDTKAAEWKTKLAVLPPVATNRSPEKAK